MIESSPSIPPKLRLAAFRALEDLEVIWGTA